MINFASNYVLFQILLVQTLCLANDHYILYVIIISHGYHVTYYNSGGSAHSVLSGVLLLSALPGGDVE